MNLMQFQQKFGTEEACLEHLEVSRWGINGGRRCCPHCGSVKTYKFKSGKLFKCGDCRKQFSVKVGTMFTDSHVPLHKWYLAIYLAFSLKKGISSIQLSKYLGVTQATAWFMLQRIRNTIVSSGNSQLLGDVQIDETYIGGNKHDGKRGRGATGKTPVVGIVEADGGELRMTAIVDTKRRTIKQLIRKNIQIGSTVMTDEYRSYNGLKAEKYNLSALTIAPSNGSMAWPLQTVLKASGNTSRPELIESIFTSVRNTCSCIATNINAATIRARWTISHGLRRGLGYVRGN